MHPRWPAAVVSRCSAPRRDQQYQHAHTRIAGGMRGAEQCTWDVGACVGAWARDRDEESIIVNVVVLYV